MLGSDSFQKGLGHARPINLTVRASDLGQPPLFTDTNVFVYVHDVNDYIPVFSHASYSVDVAEDIAPGTSILDVICTALPLWLKPF